MALNGLSLRKRMLWFNLSALLLLLGFMAVSERSLERVRINGSVYRDIRQGQQVVAETLPPPEFIIEAKLATMELIEATEAHDDKAMAAAGEQLRQLQQAFETRHRYWDQTLPAGPLRQALLSDAYAPAHAYFDAAQAQLLPRIQAHDAMGARQVWLGTLQPLFATHQRAIHAAIAIAQDQQALQEAKTARILGQTQWVMFLGWLACVLTMWLILKRWWVQPVVGGVEELGSALRRIGEGDLQPTAWRHDCAEEFLSVQRAIDLTREQVGSMVARLQEQREIAEHTAKTKSQFLANMSHEIRTPMNSIIGLTNLLRRTSLEARQRDLLDKVRHASEALLRIVNDILDFSRAEAGGIDIESRSFELDEVLERVGAIVGTRAHEKALRLLFDVADDVPSVLQGDALRLSQVLINLCANAVKFTDEGEVILSITRGQSQGSGFELCFAIRDSGIGMSAEQVEGLFSPFRQADPSTTRKYGGTGLGLAISKHLVELMGGTISVDSSPGQGSTFRFCIRFALSEVAPESSNSAWQARQAHRVLVVDPNPRSRAILLRLVANLGPAATGCPNAAQALQVFEQRKSGQNFELVIIDRSVDDLPYAALVAQIRARSMGNSTPTLILTGARPDEDATRMEVAMRLGATLVNPVTRRSLRDAMCMAMDVRANGQHMQALPEAPAPAQLRGRRILLVEDNGFNQIVATELLCGVAGAQVIIASNGIQGIEAVATQDVELVLMDIQMPEMDGYRAAALIRQLPQGRELPIVAMTAHALDEDHQRCLQAGMNDWVVKPFGPSELFAKLVQWLPPKEAKPTPALASQIDVAPAHEAVRFDLALERCMGRVDLLEKIASRFLTMRRSEPQDIRQAWSRGDLEAASHLAHAAISTAGALGAETLADIARALQHTLDEGAHGQLEVLIDRFESEHLAVAQALLAYLSHRMPHGSVS